MPSIKLISVKELLGKKFFVPSYQRGYRWDERQVLDLLNDILEFQRKSNKQEGEFYCLQPLVVKKMEDNEKYEVIDGQQRLTTLYLILKFFKNRLYEDFYIESTYDIEYETRKGSKEFLEKIDTIENINTENSDFYFISKAYIKIKGWFEEKIKQNITTKPDFLNTLLKVDIREVDNETRDVANNVRFIWYEVEPDESEQSSIDIFTRINMGKIPLTNAELIKALFFLDKNNENNNTRKEYQLMRAYEWENIEKSLQNDKFWYFISGGQNKTPTRIDFIFKLIADKYAQKADIKVNKEVDEYYTFYIFNDLINNRINIQGNGEHKDEHQVRKDLWYEVKTYFRMFEDWYNNNRYYHIIGYLINTNTKIEEIIQEYEKSNKEEFLRNLKDMVRRKININDTEISSEKLRQLEYPYNNITLRNILFLFNVLLSKDSGYSRFPFDKYIKEKWSLEHIHAQQSEEIRKDSQRKELLKDQKNYLENFQNNKGILKRIKKLLESDEIDDNEFKKLQDDIFKMYSNELDIHTIDNLALLSFQYNSSLNNNIFPIKRNKIIEFDKQGRFIPIGTKNVFLKYYSKDIEQIVKWEKNDRECYIEAIVEVLKKFFDL